jgi:hypothetical protein
LFAKPETPRPFSALAPLAGDFVSPAFGKAVLRVQGDALVLELQATGAALALKPWDGDVFTFRQLPRGRFADVVEGTPSGRMVLPSSRSTRTASSGCCTSRSTTDKRMSSVASEKPPFSRV